MISKYLYLILLFSVFKCESVLIIGVTGVGKTTLMNALCKTDYNTKFCIDGTTFRSQCGSYEYSRKTINIVDIVGLTGANSNAISDDDAIKDLIRTSLEYGGKFGAVLYLTSEKREREYTLRNYKIAKKLAANNSPFIFVYGSRGYEETPAFDAKRLEDELEEKGYKFDKVVIGNFADHFVLMDSSVTKLFRDRSIGVLKDTINDFVLTDDKMSPKMISRECSGFKKYFRELVNLVFGKKDTKNDISDDKICRFLKELLMKNAK